MLTRPASALTDERIESIKTDAREAAKRFVAEFGKPLDPLTTYWDLTAIHLAPSMQRLDGHDWARAQPIFEATMVKETRRLCEESDGPDDAA
jgi:hypothetical protein